MNKLLVSTYLFSIILYQHDTHVLFSLSELFIIINLFFSLRAGLIIDKKTVYYLAIASLLVIFSIAINIENQNRYTLFLNSKQWLHLFIVILSFNTFLKAYYKIHWSFIFRILVLGLIYQFCCYSIYLYDANIFNRLFKTSSIEGLDRFHFMSPNVFLLCILLRIGSKKWFTLVLLFLIFGFFSITQSRQTLAILLLLLFKNKILSFLRGGSFVIKLGFLGLIGQGLLSLITSVAYFFSIDERHIYRISEIQNVFISKSYWVRSFDALYVFNDVLSSGYAKVIFGLGLGKIFNIPRPGVSFGDIAKEVKPLDYIHEFATHSPDFLFSVLLIDGGLSLILLVTYIFWREFLLRKSTKALKIFISIYVFLLLGSTHLLYNSVYFLIILFLTKPFNGQKTSVFH